MADHDEHRKYVPSWDGNPTTYRAYKESVRIWLLGEKADVEYSLTARLVQNLSGAARTLGNSMTDAQLMPDLPPQADGAEVVETVPQKHDRLLSGVRRLLAVLDQLRPEGPVRKGLTMYEFFHSS